MPTTAIPLTLSPGSTADIVGGTGIGLADQTGVTSIPSFTAIAGAGTLTITPKLNGCFGTPQTTVITVTCCRPAVMTAQDLVFSYQIGVAAPVVFTGSLAAAQAARVVMAATPVAVLNGATCRYDPPVVTGSYLYGNPVLTACNNTITGTRFAVARAGFPVVITDPIWEIVDSVLIAIHP